MTDISNDESRMQATETQMRRALGLQQTASPASVPIASTPAPGVLRPVRRFVRDGEVAVSVIHHDGASGANPLEAARQAMQAQAAAREQAERLLADAQATIRDLQTKLAHERMAKEEAIQRAVAKEQASEQALEAVQADLLTAHASWQQAEQRLQELVAVRQAKKTTENPRDARAGSQQTGVEGTGLEGAVGEVAAESSVPARRRGRPRKASRPEPESEIVEWWKPGWKERYR